MAKQDKKTLMTSLKAHPDNDAFINLTTYLEFRISVIEKQLVKALEDDEIKRLQGRALELTEFLEDLRRRPVDANASFTGSFDTI